MALYTDNNPVPAIVSATSPLDVRMRETAKRLFGLGKLIRDHNLRAYQNGLQLRGVPAAGDVAVKKNTLGLTPDEVGQAFVQEYGLEAAVTFERGRKAFSYFIDQMNKINAGEPSDFDE